MDKPFVVKLKELGAEPDAALRRFAGNLELYRNFLSKFLDDDTIAEISLALETENWKKLLDTSHTLKGVAGNLGLTSLYDLSSQIVSALRGDDWETARAACAVLEAEYQSVRASLGNALQEEPS